ncbi:MAG: type II toxin-antitoxin system RelE/ParE family toxin [Lachnospiraceae bacterium]
MDYKVVVTQEAEHDLEQYVQYLLFVKKNVQAAGNLLSDFETTKNRLSSVAGNLKLCDNPRLREAGYHRINFGSHKYFLLYHVEGEIVYIDAVFHELQDYEGKMI